MMKYHCLFEQSGTFKNEFRNLGLDAYDYDILNNFGQTDFRVDLFSEIEKAYDGKESLFDKFGEEDFILAFFPCVRFENESLLLFRGQQQGINSWPLEKKMEYDMKLMGELHELYDLINKLCIICIRKKLSLVIENPFSEEHFLRRYWCCVPSIIDRDRRDNGDYYKKPTQFFFFNCTPANNVIFEPIKDVSIKCKDPIRMMSKMHFEHTGAKTVKEARSLMHPQYANRFIRQYIIKDPILAGAIPTMK